MTSDLSLEHQVALLPKDQQDEILADLDLGALQYDWGWNARPSQKLSLTDNWTLALAMAGRGWGKCVALDTMIPHTLPLSTSTGFTKMGDIKVGDTVYDEQGKPCTVTAIYDRLPDKAYRVHFSDGTHIDACDEHLWVTWTHRDRKQYLRNNPGATDFPEDWVSHREPLYHALRGGGKKETGRSVGPEVRNTQQILDTLTQNTARKDLNHCIPVARALQTPDVPLLLDPWLLGYWLGNGYSNTGFICGHLLDESEVHERLTRAGYVPGVSQKVGDVQKFEFTVLRLSVALREIGVLGNKHVPNVYLWSSEAQRRALLAGLLDSDGYCDPSNGQIEFTSMTRALADAVVQLGRSLGEKPVLSTGRAKLNGKDYGEKYRVTWRPTVNPFKLSRKAAAVRPLGSQGLRNRHRMITAVEPIEPSPMRCITVDSPNSMYLAGEGMIPTHNTLCGAQWLRELDRNWDDLGRDPGKMRFFMLGRTAADVRDVMIEGPSGIMNIYPPSLRDQIIWTPTRRSLTLPNGSQGLVFSSEEPDQLRGPAAHIGWADEMASYKQVRSMAEGNLTAWENLRIAVRLGERPQILATTTPKRVPVLKSVLGEAKDNPEKILLRRGKTLDNAKLSSGYLDTLMGLYSGTQLGKQELEGEMLDDVVGAMTSEQIIQAYRTDGVPKGVPWIKVVGVDPSVAERPHDECGIVVVYISNTWPILRRHAFVVDDLSQRCSPTVWGDIVVKAAHEHGALVVAEVNQGANLVRQMVKQSAAAAGLQNPSIREVWSSKSKAVRSEPVGGAYSRGRVHHVNVLAELEDQLCLPAGTMIETGRGHIGIEDVVQGDTVLTREGWAPVRWAGETNQKSSLSIVTHEHGCVLSTMWHRIWTSNRGFVPAHLVLPTDRLVVRPSPANMVHPLLGGAGGITGWNPDTTDMPKACSCTARSGKHIMARSQMDSKFTIETWSAGTTSSRTSRPWMPGNIGISTRACLTLQGGHPGQGNNGLLSDPLSGQIESLTKSSVLVAAANLNQPINGLVGVPGDVTGRRTTFLSSLQKLSAASAGSRSPLGTDVRLRAPNPAEGSEDTERVKVYDIQVASGYLPEFYANGVLVHNTTWVPGESGYSPDRMDALVHACAAGMFPEALIHGSPGSVVLHNVANQRIPLTRETNLPQRWGSR